MRRAVRVEPADENAGAEELPVCKEPVRRVYGGFYMPNHLQKVNVRAAKEAGFTVLKKSSKGEYEVHSLIEDLMPDRLHVYFSGHVQGVGFAIR